VKNFILKFEQFETKKLLSGYSDKEINAFMRSALADNRINRQEIIQVFRIAGDGGRVDLKEYNDLKKITSLSMSRQDWYLSSSMFSSVANKGRDLKVNSTTANLNWLIDKHFYGKHYPVANSFTTYKPVSGQLFVNGPSSEDIRQGSVGDCYLLASFAAVADKDPQTIRDRFIDNLDGTWTVSFYSTTNEGFKHQHFVTVDNMLPVSRFGYSYYASFGGMWTNPNNELWVGLLEKAYVQWNETGLTLQGDTSNSYDAISGGWTKVVFNQLYSYKDTNIEYITNVPSSESKLISALNNGLPVSVSRYMDNNRTSGHSYYISSYSQGKFYLVNPWGHSHLTFSFQELIGPTGRAFSLTIGPDKKKATTISISPISIPAKPINPPLKISPISIPAKTFAMLTWATTDTKMNKKYA
jgi:hypothetical protein